MNRVVIITDTFDPDKTSGAKLIGDLSYEIAKKNKVLILCSRSKNLKNYKKKNINIVNIFCGPIKNSNFFVRGFFEFLMQYAMWLYSKKIIKKFNPNFIICYSPSIFYSFLCKKILNSYKCKTYLILRDIFPYWLFDTRKIKNKLLKFFLVLYFKTFCEKFDKIGVEAKYNINFLKKRGIKNKIEDLPNWINIKDFQKKKIKKNYTNFIFSGNIGQGQDLNKIENLVKKIKNHNIRVRILGAGAKINKLEIFSKYKNVICSNILPYKKFIYNMRKEDFGIISLDENIKSVNYPGKLLTYLITNTPIILLTNKKNELSEFIKKNNLGIIFNSKNNFDFALKKLKKITEILKKNNNYFKNIIEKEFSVKNATNLIFKD